MAVTFHSGYGFCCPPPPLSSVFDRATFKDAYPSIRVRVPIESIDGTRDYPFRL